MDKTPLAGSVGRVLVSAGLSEISDNVTDKDVKVLIGKQYTLKVRGGKLYWYP
jgi:hypothetical protein